MKKNETFISSILKCHFNYEHFVLGHLNIPLSMLLFKEFPEYQKFDYPFIIKEGIKLRGAKLILKRPDLGLAMCF